MLSETKLGQSGLLALFKFYEKHRLVDAKTIAEDLGFVVHSDNSLYYSQFAGRSTLWNTDLEITYSCNADNIDQKMIIYHELAHYCLLNSDSSLCFPTNVNKKEKIQLLSVILSELECWCDGFAVSMMFSLNGVHLISKSSYLSFLKDGPVFEESDEEFEAKLDLFQGRRIIRLAKRYFSDGSASRIELVSLGTRLVRNGRKRLKKLSEAA